MASLSHIALHTHGCSTMSAGVFNGALERWVRVAPGGLTGGTRHDAACQMHYLQMGYGTRGAFRTSRLAALLKNPVYVDCDVVLTGPFTGHRAAQRLRLPEHTRGVNGAEGCSKPSAIN